MNAIAMIMQKGGVYKTTLSITLAQGLALMGKRVLVIDADGQGHATLALGEKLRGCLYDLLVRDADWQDVVRVVSPAQYRTGDEATGMLCIIPGNHETMHIPNAISDYHLLRRRINELSGVFDAVVIDTSPTPSLFNASILLAADTVIIPSGLEYFSLNALRATVANVKGTHELRLQHGQPPVTIGGIVPTGYRPQTTEHLQNLQAMKAVYPDQVWPHIPQRIAWAEAARERRSIFTHAPNSAAAAEAWSFVRHVAEVVYE